MSQKGEARVLEYNEFKRVEDSIMARKYKERNRAILYFSFAQGLRACEIRRLKLGDILQSDGETIKKTVQLTKTKGNKAREIYLYNKKFIKIISDHIKEMKKYLERNKIPFSLNLPLFLSQKGSYFASNGIVLLFKKFFRDAAIEGNVKSHSGRRTYITNKLEKGYAIKNISKLVGHSHIAMTARYHDSNPKILKKISEGDIF